MRQGQPGRSKIEIPMSNIATNLNVVRNLNDDRQSFGSQYGEDGILAAIFNEKGIGKGYFCEFGAWDGQHLSNTYALYEAGWSGCYIEGERSRFEDLKRNITRPGMALICAYVAEDGPYSLDAILSACVPPGQDLDILSIDIDSDDLLMWQSLKKFRPKVVVIEFNPTIPRDVVYVNPKGKNRGNSARAVFEYGKSIAYDLVASTHCNLIFMDRNFNDGDFCIFDINDSSLRLGYRYFFGFDGTLLVTEHDSNRAQEPEVFVVPWSNTVFLQPIARPFRRFAEGSMRSRVGGALSMMSCFLRRPFTMIAKVMKR
jgi:hypothetical protein